MKWDIESARTTILRNGGKIVDKKIIINSPGIKILGAIDYLINYCGYFRGGE